MGSILPMPQQSHFRGLAKLYSFARLIQSCCGLAKSFSFVLLNDAGISGIRVASRITLLLLHWNFGDAVLLRLNLNFGNDALLRLNRNFGNDTMLRLNWNFGDAAFVSMDISEILAMSFCFPQLEFRRCCCALPQLKFRR
jgi:hypothetical protein